VSPRDRLDASLVLPCPGRARSACSFVDYLKMTYFADLTPYTYGSSLEPDTLNIGWLSKRSSFATGETPEDFRAKLSAFCEDDDYIVNEMRGFHGCEFCDEAVEVTAASCRMGNGEIRVIGQQTTYAAPRLVSHYVIQHAYKPPSAFVEAVTTGPLRGSELYRALLERLGQRRLKHLPQWTSFLNALKTHYPAIPAKIVEDLAGLHEQREQPVDVNDLIDTALRAALDAVLSSRFGNIPWRYGTAISGMQDPATLYRWLSVVQSGSENEISSTVTLRRD
jgi:hypothetical protein